MKTNIGISEGNRQKVAVQLGKLLADEYVLYTKTRKAHWNIEGPDFNAMHLFFQVQYEQLDEIMDNVAERIRTVGHYSPATLKSFLELTHLTEVEKGGNTSQELIKELLEGHESIIVFLRENVEPFANDYKDMGTSDFITGLMEDHEKMAWMLRAHLRSA